MPFFILWLPCTLMAQEDTSVVTLSRVTVLSEVVIRNDLDVVSFLQRVKDDTSFYKAFKHLRVLGFTSLNDIQMLDKKGKIKASLFSKTRQKRKDNCRTMEVLEEKVTGDMYDDGNLDYYTAELYASLFFTNGKICNETNIVAGAERKMAGKSGIEKHKEQLKMLFFNPGKKIPGIPFIGNKINIFDPEVARYYDFSIDMGEYNGEYCYIFSIKAREDLSGSDRNSIVIDNMTTWFNSKNMEIAGRTYDLSYDAGVYDFDVHMEVQMTHAGGQLVPQVLRYNGKWGALFKKRERGIFTATLFDFKN